MKDCLFCKIANKKIPAEIIYEDKNFISFKDINPKALIHFLIIPKKHIKSINHLKEEDKELIGEMFIVAKNISKENKIAEKGYKLIINVGKGGGQIINHLHLHLLSGDSIKMP